MVRGARLTTPGCQTELSRSAAASSTSGSEVAESPGLIQGVNVERERGSEVGGFVQECGCGYAGTDWVGHAGKHAV